MVKGALAQARNAVHSIKGSAHTLGALQLVAYCQALEAAIREARMEEAEILSTRISPAFEDGAAVVTALAADNPVPLE
ncbi:MAG: hypothetical protein QG599_2284 [Pseudomonadota bacterium]|nr:hypothetical protein [Pseudomonadota bacterium]